MVPVEGKDRLRNLRAFEIKFNPLFVLKCFVTTKYPAYGTCRGVVNIFMHPQYLYDKMASSVMKANSLKQILYP